MEPRLKKNHPKVRDKFTSLTDKDVLDDPAVVAATARQQEVERLHADHNASIETRRAALTEVRALLQKVATEIAQITGSRGELALRAVRGDPQADRLDREAQGKLADLSRKQHLLQMGLDAEEILDTFAKVLKEHDPEGMEEAKRAIASFNQQHPQAAITPQSIRASMFMRLKREREMQNGVYLPRSRANLREEGAFANVR